MHSPRSPVRIAPPSDGRKRVGILGGTGLVGRALASRLLSHPSLCLGMVVGSPATAGQPFGPVWTEKEDSLASHYGDIWVKEPLPKQLEHFIVSSFEDLLAAGPTGTNKVDLVVSAIAASHGWMEEKLIAAGFDVFSISPYARFDPRAHLVVPEANIPRLISATKSKESWLAHAEGQSAPPEVPQIGLLVKSPNCVSCGVCLTLQAVKLRYGIESVSITTFQTLTGRGDLKYDLNLVKGNVYPLRGTVEETDAYIKREVKSILGTDFRASVTAQRVFAQRGHYVDVRVKTKSRPTDVEEALSMFESFQPLHDTPFAYLPSVPSQPIKVQRTAGLPRPVQTITSEDNEAGMAVFVGQVSTTDEVFDLTYSLVVDNVIRGAYGAALINAECYYRARELGEEVLTPEWLSSFDAQPTGLSASLLAAGSFLQKMLVPNDPDYAMHM